MNNKRIFIILGVLLLVAVLALVWLANSPLLGTLTGSGDSGLSVLRAFSLSQDYWQVEIRQTIGRDQLEAFGGPERLAETLAKQIGENLSREYTEQMEFSVKPGEKVEEGVIITTVLRGQDPAIIGSVMFDDLYGLYDPLAGPIKLTMTGEVKVGTPLYLNLLTNSSTGYGWYGMEKSEVASQKGEKFWADWRVAPGVPQIQSLDYVFDTSGDVEFTIDYTRPWEDLDTWQSIHIIISQRGFINTLDLVPNDPYFGDIPPNPIVEYESEYKWDDYWVPTSYDWTTDNNRLNKPLSLVVGNQGGCGSCWAFASTGVTEAAHQVQKGSGSFDLSEQYLLSCNSDGYDCDGGWPWWTLAYHIDKNGLNNNQPGAVQETDMPYAPFANVACSSIQNHNVKLATQHWVISDHSNGDDTSYVGDLKAAISEFGPIMVLVCGSGEFQNYRSGIFDADNCDNLNHAVLLVGWDDLTASWILKNSWGTNWGENGYMRIKFGTNRVTSVYRNKL